MFQLLEPVEAKVLGTPPGWSHVTSNLLFLYLLRDFAFLVLSSFLLVVVVQIRNPRPQTPSDLGLTRSSMAS